MKRASFVAIVMFALTALGAGAASAQEWTAEQKTAWAAVEGYWAYAAAENLDSMMAAYDDNYSGWAKNDPFPSDKASVGKWTKYALPEYDVIIYELNPAAITVFDDVAVVHYFYTAVTMDKEGKKTRSTGRYTDILKKFGDKWLLLADTGGDD